MGTTPLNDSYDEIILGGMPLKLRGTMPDSNLSTFQRKMVIGDYTKDSNPLLSAWVISDLSGGSGVYDLNESSDTTRYYYGNMYTRFAAQITSGYQIYTLLGTNGPGTRYLGDLYFEGEWWAMFCMWNGTDWGVWKASRPPDPTAGFIYDQIDDPLTTEPAGHSIGYRGQAGDMYLIVPQGLAGYDYIDQTTLTVTHVPVDPADAPALLDMVIWDDKLLGIDVDGQLWWTIDPTTGWQNYGPTAKVPTDEIPRRLISYFDRGGEPCVFVLTELRLWQFNPDGPQIFDVDVQFPPGPFQGLAGTKWSGDMYFSVGMGVHRYTGGALSAMGLDRDSGLPVEYNGYIVDMAASYNSLYALVQRPDLSRWEFPAGEPTALTSLHEWTGVGWHMIQEWANTDAVGFSMGISRAAGSQALIFGLAQGDGGFDGGLMVMPLPTTFANPRQRMLQTTGFTQNQGFLVTGVFDGGMPGYKKVASALDVKMTVCNVKYGGLFTISYKIDDAPDWPILGQIGDPGTHSFSFGLYHDLIHEGSIFERIQFKFDASFSCEFLMESAVLSFIKTVPPSNSWTPTIDMSTEYAGNSPAVMQQHVDDILLGRVFVPMVLRGKTYRVLVSSSSGSSQTGTDESSLRQISLLEIPISLGDV